MYFAKMRFIGLFRKPLNDGLDYYPSFRAESEWKEDEAKNPLNLRTYRTGRIYIYHD